MNFTSWNRWKINSLLFSGKVITWDATGGGTYKTVKFFENLCPKYPWVEAAPSATTGYTATPFDELKEVKLYQFAFEDGDNDATTFGSQMWYHCLVIFFARLL